MKMNILGHISCKMYCKDLHPNVMLRYFTYIQAFMHSTCNNITVLKQPI